MYNTLRVQNTMIFYRSTIVCVLDFKQEKEESIDGTFIWTLILLFVLNSNFSPSANYSQSQT